MGFRLPRVDFTFLLNNSTSENEHSNLHMPIQHSKVSIFLLLLLLFSHELFSYKTGQENKTKQNRFEL